MSTAMRVGIAGLGTVGAGTVSLLQENAALIAARSGRPIVITAVSARDKNKNRGLALEGIKWVDDATELAQDDQVDVVVELMGGSEGPARILVESALQRGKPVVTANKALIAHHGVVLAALAESNNVMLAFEAAVAGGIPIIDVLRNGLAANHFKRIAGILNGTCNYILSTMKSESRDFDDVLAEAQALGYAEADPGFDIDGIDAAHKLAILTSLAFGTQVDVATIITQGIRHITKRDMHYAHELGYAIKLLGIAEQTPDGILQRVHPCLVPLKTPIAVVGGAFNAVHLEGNAVGRVLLEGAGAGAGPTASSVVADLLQIARGVHYHPFTVSSAHLLSQPPASMDDLVRGYYLRVQVADKPGVLADITSIFAKESISVQSLIQHSHLADTPAEVVIITHETLERSMQRALQQIASLASVVEAPYMIRIENL